MTSSENNTNQLTGVFSVIQMPYHDDETIDYDTLAHEVDWLYRHGVDGLVVAMVSEVLRLTEQERREVAAFLVQHGQNRGRVITSVGAESSYQACELTRAAEAAGVDALMAVPPIAIAADESEIRRYYERIVHATKLPVIVQDASGYVGKPMSITMQAQLLNDLGSQIYFKPEAVPICPRLTALLETTDGQARIFEGTGGISLVDSYRRGIVGTMPGAEMPWAIRALWDALEANDKPRINNISLPLAALVSMQKSLDTFLAFEKYLLVKQGVFQNTIIRGPVGYQIEKQTCVEIDRIFDLLQQAAKPTA